MYKYDAEGKLMASYVYDLTTYNNLYGTSVSYDEQSRVHFVHHNFDYKSSSGIKNGGIDYSYWYDDSTGNLDKFNVYDDRLDGEITPTYDNFGRTTQKIVDFNVNNADAFYNKISYTYVNSTYSESGRVNSMWNSVSSTTYIYSYDDNGNITEIKDTRRVIQYKYYYDDLGQLIREDNNPLGYSYVYTYDKAGNITSKNRYAFTTGTLGSVQNTTSYTYGDSSWRDLLTNYDGTAITYDQIGNPISFDDRTLDWEGRELVCYNNVGISVCYGYNADGIRTYKEIDYGDFVERRHGLPIKR